MATKQILSSITDSKDSTDISKFEIYYSQAIRDCLEPNEDFSQFTTEFLKKTVSNEIEPPASMEEPRSPKEFCSRKYTGGR